MLRLWMDRQAFCRSDPFGLDRTPGAPRKCPTTRPKWLGGLHGTIVVGQNATDPLTALNRSLAVRSPERLNQLVPDSLMIPLAMVVGYELGNRASKTGMSRALLKFSGGSR